MQSNIYTKCSKLVFIYLFIMFGVFPLFFRDGFYDIQRAKFLFFTTISTIFIIITIIVIGSEYLKNEKKPIKFHLPKFSFCDKAILLWVFAAILSTLMSQYPKESILGSQGRWMGLIIYLIIGFLYFLITRFFKKNQEVFLVFLISSFLVSVLGVLNFFDIDVLGFYTYLSDNQSNIFLSTIGNIDFVGSFVCLFLPLATVCYCHTEQKITKIFFLVSMISGIVFMFISNADSAYLGIGVFLIIFLFYSLKDITQFKKYISVLLIMCLSAKILNIFCIIFDSSSHVLYTLSSLFVRTQVSTWAFVILGLTYYFLYVFDKKHKTWDATRIKKNVLWISFIVFIIIVGLVYYFTKIDQQTNLSYFGNYFRFDDNWGSGRGFIWNKAIEAFNAMPLLQKFFGYGLDTTKLIFINVLQDSSLINWDNVHNEFLQYLLNGGIFMILTYLILITTILYRGWKYAKVNPIMLGTFMSCASYLAQSTVNLNQSVTTPLFFLMLIIMESFNKDVERENLDGNTIK